MSDIKLEFPRINYQQHFNSFNEHVPVASLNYSANLYNSSNNQIVSFVSLVHGTGSGTLAFNVAWYLSNFKKVLYLSTKKLSQNALAYNLPTANIKISDLNSNLIIGKSDLLAQEKSFMSVNYQQFPNNLFFLILNQQDITTAENYYRHLDFWQDFLNNARTQYDYIIIDNENADTIENRIILNLSQSIVNTVTQNYVSLLANNKYFEKHKYKAKIITVLNQFNKSDIISELSNVYKANEYLSNDLNLIINNIPKTNNAIFNGLPYYKYGQDNYFNNKIKSLANSILD